MVDKPSNLDILKEVEDPPQQHQLQGLRVHHHHRGHQVRPLVLAPALHQGQADLRQILADHLQAEAAEVAEQVVQDQEILQLKLELSLTTTVTTEDMKAATKFTMKGLAEVQVVALWIRVL